jgi:hypothetical protein
VYHVSRQPRECRDQTTEEKQQHPRHGEAALGVSDRNVELTCHDGIFDSGRNGVSGSDIMSGRNSFGSATG